MIIMLLYKYNLMRYVDSLLLQSLKVVGDVYFSILWSQLQQNKL